MFNCLRLFFVLCLSFSLHADTFNKKVAYIASDMSIPFWQILSRGIQNASQKANYSLTIYNAKNDAKLELESVVDAIKNQVDAIIISPMTSVACVTVLNLAKEAKIPVIIADVGTDDGEYLSYISSNNKQGAYDIAQILIQKMQERNFMQGTVGIIAIPQKRLNGQARTQGFMQALKEANISGADIKQQINFSLEETYLLAKELIQNNKNLKAIWLQGSDKYEGALQAIEEAGKKEEILLITFDAEPIFLELIPQGVLVGAAMQQPFLMGEKAIEVLDSHFKGESVTQNIQLPILAISQSNIDSQLPVIKRNVLGLEETR
ncbi:MAG: substrate-binding domain-containing protein [Arcobacteraceae bacterium]|nr:substrate-binding domain-containing protein [Arcobacteraceae bacterium]